jgi:hypothetical protein
MWQGCRREDEREMPILVVRSANVVELLRIVAEARMACSRIASLRFVYVIFQC